MVKHIIWDWNGTLVDDVELCVDILNQNLLTYGMKRMSVAEYRHKFFFPVAEFYQSIGLPSFGSNYVCLANNYIQEYRHRFMECTLHQGALEVVSELNRMGISQSILSAGKQSDLETFTSFFGISKWMTQIDGANNVQASGKEDRALAHLKNHHIKQHDVIIVGDTLHDWDVARLLGCKAILSELGHISRNRLLKVPALIIKHLKEVVNWVHD